MRRLHPLWRGFYLALAMTAALFLLGATDALTPFLLDRRMLVFSGAVAVGTFIATLPRRLRRSAPAAAATWQRCLRNFLCGAAMILALRMAGDGRILPALMTGSTGAYAFCGAALITGFLTVRIAERGRAA